MPREELLFKLVAALRRRGYDATTMADLAAASGLDKASLYHHFPGGKADIARAAMLAVVEGFQRGAVKAERAGTPPAERLERQFSLLRAYFGDPSQVCLMASLAASDRDEQTAEDLRAVFEGWIGALASTLRAAGIARGEARRRAEEAVALIEGALIVARGTGNPAVLNRVLRDLPTRLLRT